MDKSEFQKALAKLRESSKKRKFAQTIDLIVNLQQLDLKNPENKVDLPVILPAGSGKVAKICGLVDKELGDASKKSFDHTILKDDFSSLKPKEIKKLADTYDFFVAQATLMVDAAKTFGKILGPRFKMPNPKMGCVIPPNANLEQVKTRLNNTVRFQTNRELIVKGAVGKEDMSDEQLINNLASCYDAILHAVPNDKSNIASVFIKFTMSAPVKVGEKQ